MHVFPVPVVAFLPESQCFPTGLAGTRLPQDRFPGASVYHMEQTTPTDFSWLGSFAARLLRLTPDLRAVDAVQVAKQRWARDSELDPAQAAEIYVRESGAHAVRRSE